MAKYVVTGTFLSINSVDRSGDVSQVNLELTSDVQDATVMTSEGWKAVIGGLKSFTVTVNFKKDSDFSGLDAAMFALFGTVTTFVIKPTSAAVGSTNPSYSGSLLIDKWTPITGSVGDLNQASYTFTGSGKPTRATS